MEAAPMNHADHLDLLRAGVPKSGGLWADLGAGTGAFTMALAELIGPGGQIYAVDTNGGALKRLEHTVHSQFPSVILHMKVADFTRPLELPPLDGIVMANSLHFLRDKIQFVEMLHGYLRPGGRLLLVEYNTDRGNQWVPYPLAFPTWEKLAAGTGFSNTRLLATKPSRFLGQIYSAASV
jgi:SAM-dependent methyltransferase